MPNLCLANSKFSLINIENTFLDSYFSKLNTCTLIQELTNISKVCQINEYVKISELTVSIIIALFPFMSPCSLSFVMHVVLLSHHL